MPMGPNCPPFFWISPLMGLAIFLAFILVFVFATLTQIKRFLQSRNRQALSGRSHSNKNTKARQSSVEVPEELRRKAKEMMEEIDWDIRLLEGQLETEKDKEERKKLQREIEEKRQQYGSIVFTSFTDDFVLRDRFGW